MAWFNSMDVILKAMFANAYKKSSINIISSIDVGLQVSSITNIEIFIYSRLLLVGVRKMEVIF